MRTEIPRSLSFPLVGVLALAAIFVSGCATVQPWERQTLAHECMANPVDAWDQAYFGHVAAVREGSSGGSSRGGGGCGCN